MDRIERFFCLGLLVCVLTAILPSLGISGPPEQTITTTPISAAIQYLFGIAVDPQGNLLVSHDGRAVSRLEKNGELHRVAGGTIKGFEGDGDLASQSLLLGPGRLAFDRQGNLFIPDMGNHRIRKVEYPSGIITTVVGDGPTGRRNGSFGGDAGPGIAAFLKRPISVAFDQTGALYIADAGNFRIRKVSPGKDGIITGAPDEHIQTVAGMGKRGFTRDRKLAVTARITPVDVAIDSAGHLFFADASNNRIRRVDKDTGIIGTVVGSGPAGEVAGYSGNGAAAKRARMSSPEGIAFDRQGNLYIADTLNHRVRMVTPGQDRLITGEADETITTIVGSGTIGISAGGFEGDGGPASEARLNRPQDVVIDHEGNLMIVDGLNHRLRHVILRPAEIFPILGPAQVTIPAPPPNTQS